MGYKVFESGVYCVVLRWFAWQELPFVSMADNLDQGNYHIKLNFVLPWPGGLYQFIILIALEPGGLSAF